MKVAERIHRAVNDAFAAGLDRAFNDHFGCIIDTTFDLLGTMTYVSRRYDGKRLTGEQHNWIGAWAEGYAAAQGLIK